MTNPTKIREPIRSIGYASSSFYKIKCLHFSLLNTKRHNSWWVSGFWRQHMLLLGKLLQSIYWVTQKLSILSEAQSKSRLYCRSGLCQHWPLDPMIQAQVLDIPGVDQYTTRCLQQAPIRNLYFRPLGVWSKTSPSAAGNNFLFEEVLKWLLVEMST